MSSSKTTPRIALLGCGYWGRNLARNFHQLGALQLICDPALQAAEAARAVAPGVELQASFLPAFQRGDIDAVAIATPAETHFDLARQAIEAGKDVFVEKPLALKTADGRQLLQLAATHGRVVMVGHLLEYHPAVLRLREMVREGQLGRVNYIYSHRLNFGKIRTEENALWSFAPHDVAVILRLAGEMPQEVTCVGGSYVTPHLADVTVSTLRFRSGLRAHIFVSWLNPFKEQRLGVVGENRMAVFDDVAPADKLVLYDQRVEFDGRMPVLQKNGCKPVALSNDEPLRMECEHFLARVRDRQTPLTDAASGLRVLQVLEACQTSLQLNGQPVMIE